MLQQKQENARTRLKNSCTVKDVDDVRTSFHARQDGTDRNEKAAQSAIETAKAEVNVTLGRGQSSPMKDSWRQ